MNEKELKRQADSYELCHKTMDRGAVLAAFFLVGAILAGILSAWTGVIACVCGIVLVLLVGFACTGGEDRILSQIRGLPIHERQKFVDLVNSKENIYDLKKQLGIYETPRA